MRVYQRIAQLVTNAQHCNEEWANKAVEELEELVLEYLPHGSGFDSGCEVDVDSSKPNRVIIHTSYHHMDEYGSYDGWTNHDIILVPDLVRGFDFRVTGRNTRDDIKTYIGDMFAECLDRVVPDACGMDSRMLEYINLVDEFLRKRIGYSDLKNATDVVRMLYL